MWVGFDKSLASALSSIKKHSQQEESKEIIDHSTISFSYWQYFNSLPYNYELIPINLFLLTNQVSSHQ